MNKIYIPLWVKILAHMNHNEVDNISQLSMDMRLTNLSLLFRELDNFGLTKSQRMGRTKKVFLTKKGEDIAKLCFEINSKISEFHKQKEN